MDNDGNPVESGDSGELFSRSPYLFNGYWNNETATQEAFRDSWISVGDLARMDDEGYVYIQGRKSDLVISGGINIYPREIEEVLTSHQDISEAAVVGLPDEKWGERLVAYVVLLDAGTATSDGLTAYCRERLAGYKVPKEIRFVDSLQKNTNGKILKRELKKQGISRR